MGRTECADPNCTGCPYAVHRLKDGTWIVTLSHEIWSPATDATAERGLLAHLRWQWSPAQMERLAEYVEELAYARFFDATMPKGPPDETDRLLTVLEYGEVGDIARAAVIVTERKLKDEQDVQHG
jgi:hypothetical protein